MIIMLKKGTTADQKKRVIAVIEQMKLTYVVNPIGTKLVSDVIRVHGNEVEEKDLIPFKVLEGVHCVFGAQVILPDLSVPAVQSSI